MQERHKNRQLYFNEQAYTTEKYVIPFIERYKAINQDSCVLEIGCGEGGNLKPFLDLGCNCTGVDLNGIQIDNAIRFFENHPYSSKAHFVLSDIFDVDPSVRQYDIIMLRDVIEHIHNQERFMQLLPKFLKLGGVVFLAFPPWLMPFGGHQQICASKLSKLPYFHLLPKSLYRWVLKKNGESEGCIRALLEIKETGISLERFERILRAGEFITVSRNLFFINPNYEVKFHLRPRKAAPLLRNIPYLRDFYITAGYYLISAKP